MTSRLVQAVVAEVRRRKVFRAVVLYAIGAFGVLQVGDLAFEPLNFPDWSMQALILATPILGAGLVVGLLVSLFQAVTQIQEQTLTFVPKIVVMIMVAVLLLSWITIQMLDFATAMFTGM